jgi:signal transduction histidine kinase
MTAHWAVKARSQSPEVLRPGRAASAFAPRTFATRRRLIAVFSVVLAVFLSALALQLVALRRMEGTFEAMKAHEEEMRLALQLEDAVRDQYGHEIRFVTGDSALVEYEEARARVLELSRTLTERVDEPEAIAWMRQIRDASTELDRVFREEVAPSVNSGRSSSTALHAGSYPLVSLIEHNVDDLFELLQQRTSAYRRDLVELETAALRWTATLLIATPLFVAAAVFYLSRSVAMPLARLSEGAAAVAGGNLDARIEIHTPDEFGALAAEFNAMTVALKQNQMKLVESEKLAGIGRLAAGVANELNNPLQVMIGYLSFNRGVSDRRLAEHLEAIEAEALRCREIVDGLLELSRPSLAPAPVDLRELCDDVAAGLRVSMQARARLGVEGAGVACGDGPKLRQAIFNLMKNAVEATDACGNVEVRIASSDVGHVEVAVCDDGPGIVGEARARVFEPFFTTKAAGTGLGLAVSRAIALAHGGDIDVKNRDPGGAVFTLRLPRAAQTEELT